MRKTASLSLVLATLAIAGCGGGSGEEAGSPLDEALGYLPADTPFAVAIDTDVDGEQFRDARDLADKFPFGDQVEDQLRGLLEDRAGELEQLERALGNEFVVGSTDARRFVTSGGGEDQAFVGAIKVDSQEARDKLIEGDRAEQDGEIDGAKVYKDDDGDSFAIDGDVLVVAGNRSELETALATRDAGDGFSQQDFDAGTEGVSRDALVRVYLDVGGLLQASPDARQALKSKWVAALRTGGLALTFRPDRVAIDVRVNTDPEGLTDADLPIAAGADAPQVLDRDGAINVSLRDPAQVVDFALATARTVDPDGFGGFEAGRAQIERRLKIDLQRDLFDQLEGDLAVSIDLDGNFGARAQLEDPAAFERTLAKLEPILPSLAEGLAGQRVGIATPKAGEDFYAVATGGGDQVVFGVVKNMLVISDDAELAGTLASARSAAVPAAKGALVLRGDAEQIAREALARPRQSGDDSFQVDVFKRIRGAIGTRPLDELLGSFEVTTEGLSGSVEVTTD